MSLEDINKVKETIRELENELCPTLINDTTILLAIDTQGGMDRLMLGKEGLISNANETIKSWNIGRKENEIMDLLPTTNITIEDVDNALSVLYTDNFSVVKTDKTIVTNEYIIGRNISVIDSELIIVDLCNIEFNKYGLFNILYN